MPESKAMTQYDRHILGTMFKILSRLLFLVAFSVVHSTNDIVLKSLVSDYAILVERIDLWRDSK